MAQIIFDEKFHPEFDGYIWESNGGVWISFIKSKQEGKGHFRKFLNELKEKYLWIRIPTPSNRMKIIAMLNGFFPKQEYNKFADEVIDLMYWER